VWAHAVLGQHPHVVRYYSAWAENGHMIIQNEFCNSGTLEELIRSNQQNNVTVIEPQLKSTLLQVCFILFFSSSYFVQKLIDFLLFSIDCRRIALHSFQTVGPYGYQAG
jgi:wee1-like protein kinase